MKNHRLILLLLLVLNCTFTQAGTPTNASVPITQGIPLLDKQPLHILRGHVPREISHLQPVRRLAATNQLHLALGLPLRNRENLTNLLQQLYEPKNPLFRHYLTSEQFTEKFGPSKQDYDNVIAYARSNGFKVRQTHSNRMVLDVDGAVTDVERTFHVRMHGYQHPTEARTFYSPDAEPSVPAETPIMEISGLNNYATIRPSGGSGYKWYAYAQTTYLGPDFRAAYAPDVHNTGAGQTIGLLEFDGYYTNDIAYYASQAGITNYNVTNVQVDGSTGIPNSSGIDGANDEVSGDIEMMISMAPDAQVIVYEGVTPATGLVAFVDIMNRIATDNLAHQVSCSWGSTGNSVVSAAADQIFQEFALQGQSFFQGSGDWGANFTSISPPSTVTPNPFTFWPSDNPYITSVGGTTLSTSGPAGFWSSETVWNDLDSGTGSTGGVSPNYPIPSWQQGMNMSSNGGSTTMRNFPDVSMVANDIAVFSQNSTNLDPSWGTSWATPLWAAFTALANEQAAANGQPSVGFINPTVYAMANSPNYSAVFHDVTIGDNTTYASPNAFFAVPGYDLCTGWGSPMGQNFITLLLNPGEPLIITPGTGFSSVNGPFGGAFSIHSQQYALSNQGPASIAWAVGNTAPWLAISTSSGTLSGNSTTELTVSLTPVADTLAPARYETTVWFTNLTSHVAQSRKFILEAGQTIVKNGGFESGDYSYWTGWGDWNGWDDAYIGGRHFGQFGATFWGGDVGTHLCQTLNTVPGQSYAVSFWIYPLYILANTANSGVYVTWGGNPVYSMTNSVDNNNGYSPTKWTNSTVIVQATSSSTMLQFDFLCQGSLDDISVTPLTLPPISSMTPTNGAIALTWSAVSGLSYQVQSCSDLTLGNWTNLPVGPIAATNNSVTATDVIGSDLKKFYRVVLQH